MAIDEHVAIFLKGEKAWNQWRQENRGVLPDLSGTDFAELLKSSSYWRDDREILGPGDWITRGKKIIIFDVDLGFTNLDRCNLRGIRFSKVDFTYTTFGDGIVEEAEFINCLLEHSVFMPVQGSHAVFKRSTLSSFTIQSSNLDHAQFSDCRIECDWRYCSFANASFVDCDARSATIVQCDFSGATLAGSDFRSTEFEDNNCSHAHFAGVRFDDAKLDRTNFSGASLGRCSIRGASIRSTTWHRTHIFALTYRMADFDGQTYGMAVTELTGDAVFFRRLLDQVYLDTIRADIWRARPSIPKRYGGAWRRRLDVIVLWWRVVLSGLLTPWPIVAMAGVIALVGMLAPETLGRLLHAAEHSGSLSGATWLVLQSGVFHALIAAAIVGTVGASWLGRLFVFWTWGLFDYGRSWVRVGVFAIMAIALFGAGYSISRDHHVHFLHAGPTVSGGFYPWFAASMGFATLGISDLVEPLDMFGQLLMIGNVLSGFVTLGLMMAVLANSFARRA
jgi:uncharacterized protein YjbI with pentapeptide repeats